LSKKRIHIDQLFKNGLKHLSFLVSNKDLESIDKKTEAYSDEKTNNLKERLDQISFPISDLDWEQTFSKFQKEKMALEPSKSMFAKLEDLELPITETDWTQTKTKLANQKRKRVFIWWKVASVLIALALIGGLVNHVTKTDIADNPSKNSLENKANESIANTQQNFNNSVEHQALKNKTTDEIHSENHQNASISNISKVKTPENSESEQIEAIDILTNQKATELGIEIMDIEKISLQTLKSFQILYPNIAHALIENIKIKPPIIPVTKPSFYIGLNNAIINNGQHYNAKNNADFNNIQQSADARSLSWSKGISMGIFNKGFQHQISINQMNVNQVSNYKFSYRIFDSIPVKDPMGNVIGHFLTRGRDTSINETQVIKRNRLDFTINTNKIWNINSKFNLVTGIGAQTGINLSSKGDLVLDPNTNRLSDYQSIKNEERKVNIAPMVSIGIQNRFSKQFVLETGVSTQYNLFPVYKSNISNQINNYQMGLHFKILYLIK
jgi:hypothetical protein